MLFRVLCNVRAVVAVWWLFLVLVPVFKHRSSCHVSCARVARALDLALYLTVSTCGNASCKHAMLVNGASFEISEQMMTRCLLWRDVVVCLSFTNFCDWPSVDPDLPTAPYDLKELCIFRRTYTCVESLTTKHGWTYQKAEFVDNHFSPQYNTFRCFLLQIPQTIN